MPVYMYMNEFRIYEWTIYLWISKFNLRYMNFKTFWYIILTLKNKKLFRIEPIISSKVVHFKQADRYGRVD